MVGQAGNAGPRRWWLRGQLSEWRSEAELAATQGVYPGGTPDGDQTVGPAPPLVAEWRELRMVGQESGSRVDRARAALPHPVESTEGHGHLDLDPEVRDRLLAATAATLDRLLKPIRP